MKQEISSREKEVFLQLLGWKQHRRRVGFDGYSSEWNFWWTEPILDDQISVDYMRYSLDNAYDYVTQNENNK